MLPGKHSEAASRRAILVMGMHRSGTSAVARMLGLCGADLPRETLPANEHNETGYWEPEAVVRLHDEFLSASGSWFDDLGALPSNWHSSPLASEYGGRLREVLEDAYGQAPLWVVKDPRLCRLAPLWRVVLDQLKVRPLAVIPVRNPLEVAASLGQRDKFSESKCLLLWLRHFLEAEEATRAIPRSFVLYESLLQDWRGVVGRIGRELAIEWPRSLDSAAAEIETFLDPARRHHASSHDDLAARSEISPWVSAAYRWAVEAAQGGTLSTSALDETREALAVADLAFSPLLADWRHDRVELTAASARVTRLLADVRDAEGKLVKASDESQKLHRALTARETRIDGLESEREGLRLELKSVRAQHLSELKSLDERHRAGVESMRARHASELAAMRAEARKGVEEMRGHWLEARRELHSIRASVSWRLSKPLRWVEGRSRGVAQDLFDVFRCCWTRPRNPLRLWRQLRLLRRSGLFDEPWYLEQNPDVVGSRLGPMTHYLCFGAAEGRDPSPVFGTGWYLRRNPDVAASHLNPLVHYFLYGAAEGRDPRPGPDPRSAPGRPTTRSNRAALGRSLTAP